MSLGPSSLNFKHLEPAFYQYDIESSCFVQVNVLVSNSGTAVLAHVGLAQLDGASCSHGSKSGYKCVTQLTCILPLLDHTITLLLHMLVVTVALYLADQYCQTNLPEILTVHLHCSKGSLLHLSSLCSAIAGCQKCHMARLS